MSRVAVVGGGGFGCALATALVRNSHEVTLWTRRTNLSLPEGILITSDVSKIAEATLVFLAVPSPHVQGVCETMCPHLDGRHFLVHVSRGLVGESLTPISNIIQAHTAVRRVGVLAGPLTEEILASDTPGGVVVGTRFSGVRQAVEESLANDTLRVFSTTDVIGVEVASAVVGLMALGAGFAIERGFDPASLAVFVTRGMVEGVRIGRKLGASDRTFRGLAGFGDLMAVIAGDDRPEVRLGRALAQGSTLAVAAKNAGAHIEGVRIAERVSEFGNKVGIDTPICRVMAEVLRGRLHPDQAVQTWMTDSSGHN